MPGKPLPVWPHSHCRTSPRQDWHVGSGNRAPSPLPSHGRKLRLAQAYAADGLQTRNDIVTIRQHRLSQSAWSRQWPHPLVLDTHRRTGYGRTTKGDTGRAWGRATAWEEGNRDASRKGNERSMQSVKENERLTRVGPCTPMGALLRRYWLPVAASAELAEQPVKPIKLLGESLVLFRDRQGRLGLIGDTCPHRRISLLYGIPEEE